MRIVTVVGARPQFVKAAALSPDIRRKHREYLVHTGQHYDFEMSAVFFQELAIPEPDRDLEVGSGTHAHQTAEILTRLEPILFEQRPDLTLVYGDTNSTLAAALCSVKLHIPVAHVEAGLRSHRWTAPEEINRVMTDHVSSLLFCPVRTAVKSLADEGVRKGVHFTGDVMLDLTRRFEPLARARDEPQRMLGVEPGGYYLATIHRPFNTDSPARLSSIISALAHADRPVIFPAHPRTKSRIAELRLWPEGAPPARIQVVKPQGYLDMMSLALKARKIITDSGGLQKEAYFLGVPCVTCNTVTEWTETLEGGWNVLAGADEEEILAALATPVATSPRSDHYGDGRAAEHIAGILDQGPPTFS